MSLYNCGKLSFHLFEPRLNHENEQSRAFCYQKCFLAPKCEF